MICNNKEIWLIWHAESYCSFQGGESLNSCPNKGYLQIHSAVHKLSCSSTTRCHHSAVHKQWWACIKSQNTVRSLSHMHRVWTYSLEAIISTGNGNWVWLNRFRTFGQSQTWGRQLPSISFCTGYRKWWSFLHISEEKHMNTGLGFCFRGYNKGWLCSGVVSALYKALWMNNKLRKKCSFLNTMMITTLLRGKGVTRHKHSICQ